MKFGIYSSIANPPRGEHLDRCVDQVIAEAQLAEASGFDSCFFGEHHQDKDGFLPSPLIVATAVAAQTRTLNVGTSVILLPLHHPGARRRGRHHPGYRLQRAHYSRRRGRLSSLRLPRLRSSHGRPRRPF